MHEPTELLREDFETYASRTNRRVTELEDGLTEMCKIVQGLVELAEEDTLDKLGLKRREENAQN